MFSCGPPPLVTVTLLFRSKTKFSDLPHVVSAVSLFLDASVELPLNVACQFGSLTLLDRIWNSSDVYANMNNSKIDDAWTLRRFLRTDPHYKQYQFTKSMKETIRLEHFAMIRWLVEKFPNSVVTSDVVAQAASSGSLEMLQFFYDQDNRDPDTTCRHGLQVQWAGNYLAAGVRSRSSEVVEWLFEFAPSDDAQQSTALEAAVCSDNIPMAEWLLAHGATWTRDGRTLRSAHYVAENSGRVEMLQWLEKQGQLDGLIGLVIKAAEKGYFDAVRWLLGRGAHDNGLEVETRLAIHSAASNGHLDIAKYLRSRSKRSVTSEQREEQKMQEQQLLRELVFGFWSIGEVSGKTMVEASNRGFLDVVQWLYMEFNPDIDLFKLEESDETAMDAAAANGHLNVLQYLHELQISIDNAAKKRKRDGTIRHENPKCTIDAMNYAAGNGHLDVVQWLHVNRTEGCSIKAMNDAAMSGHLEVVQWLFENRSVGCTTDTMDSAAQCGHLDVVRWLHVNTRAECTKKAMDSAAANGHLELVKWLHDNRSEGCTTDAMDRAAATGKLNVVKWLHLNRSEGCTKKAMNLAAESNNLQMLRWLHSHRSEGCSSSAIAAAATNGSFEAVLYLHSQCHQKCTEQAFIWTIDDDVGAWFRHHQEG